MSRNPVGIMQGRLSPQIGDRIQAFPRDTWPQEFERAAGIGFDEIEFIFEADNFQDNPLYTTPGLKEIEKQCRATGVKVSYVCADYFMEQPFIRVAEADRKASVEVLKELIKKCASIGVKGIEIPMVDNARLETTSEKELFVECLRECLPTAETAGVRLGLETSLAPGDFKNLLERIDHPLVEANYDTGNSASLGYDPDEEIATIGGWVHNIHIKDRMLGGGTVPLGQGNTEFPRIFQALAGIPYRGSFILQTARKRDDLKAAREYLAFVRQYIRDYLES